VSGAVALPPTFITGLFGMNVKGLPFTDDEFGFIYATARRWHGNYGDISLLDLSVPA
jgi:hypothetical protein